MIRPNPKYSGKQSLKVQLLINNIKPLPILGRSLEALPPGRSVLYELIKPDNSSLDLTVSACQGVVRVEVISLDGESPVVSQYSYIGRNWTNTANILEEMTK